MKEAPGKHVCFYWNFTAINFEKECKILAYEEDGYPEELNEKYELPFEVTNEYIDLIGEYEDGNIERFDGNLAYFNGRWINIYWLQKKGFQCIEWEDWLEDGDCEGICNYLGVEIYNSYSECISRCYKYCTKSRITKEL